MLRRTPGLRFCKYLLDALPLRTQGHHCFADISPEAVWLTLLLKENFVVRKKKERKGLSGRAAGSLALWGGSDRPDLGFIHLLFVF